MNTKMEVSKTFQDINEYVDPTTLFEFDSGLLMAGLNSGVEEENTLPWCLTQLVENDADEFIMIIENRILHKYDLSLTESDKEMLTAHFNLNVII